VGEAVVGADLVGGLLEVRGQRERLLMVRQRFVWFAGGVVEPAEALQGLKLIVTIVDLSGDVEDSPVVVDGRRVPALHDVDLAETGPRVQLTGAVTDREGEPQGLLVVIAGRRVPAL
jgi:hypothetical protein